uniref:Uncharacterized protein n=1 Tax=Plectus sambesii TaxID=2011161 RepID=A0A914VR74_9BILA
MSAPSATTATYSDEDDDVPYVTVASMTPVTSPPTNRYNSTDKDVCNYKNEPELLQALNSTVVAGEKGSAVETTAVKVTRKRAKHPICDRVVVVIVVVGILFMMCTVLAALYLLLRILLTPTTQRNSPFGVAGLSNAHRHGSFHDTNIEVKELIDKARRLLSSSIGTRFLQPRGRLKSPPYGYSATIATPGSTLITSDSSDS